MATVTTLRLQWHSTMFIHHAPPPQMLIECIAIDSSSFSNKRNVIVTFVARANGKRVLIEAENIVPMWFAGIARRGAFG